MCQFWLTSLVVGVQVWNPLFPEMLFCHTVVRLLFLISAMSISSDPGCGQLHVPMLPAVVGKLEQAKTLVWNGPFGAFEMPPFDAAIVDFPDPNTFALGKLYTTRFYKLLKDKLAPGAAWNLASGASTRQASPSRTSVSVRPLPVVCTRVIAFGSRLRTFLSSRSRPL